VAGQADVAVIIVGYDGHDEGEYLDPAGMATPELLALLPPLPPGEALPALDAGGYGMTGGDRTSLRLHPGDEELIRAVARAALRTVVCVVAGGAVIMEGWRHDVPAILIMWYAGMDGGHALADVITGVHNPSGRLPFSVPAAGEHLPSFDRDATLVSYDRFHGQRLLDKLGVAAAYPHGFGLSYTTFTVADAVAGAPAAGQVPVTARVRNSGRRDGWHVVQVYGRRTEGERAGERALVGFATVAVPAGETAEVAVACSLDPLAVWNPASRQLDPPARTTIALEVGSHAHDPAAVTLDVPVP
jgi:beta-glucosidase